MPHELIISLGSNTQKEALTGAITLLKDKFEIISASDILESQAVGNHYQSPFYNQAVKLLSGYEKEETIQIFKETEKKMGRTPESKEQGIVTMDIDLIVWNREICHNDYYRFDFVKKCVDKIK